MVVSVRPEATPKSWSSIRSHRRGRLGRHRQTLPRAWCGGCKVQFSQSKNVNWALRFSEMERKIPLGPGLVS